MQLVYRLFVVVVLVASINGQSMTASGQSDDLCQKAADIVRGTSCLEPDTQARVLDEYLEHYDVNLAYPEHNCKTIAMRAAYYGNWEVLDYLKQQGANLNARCANGGSVYNYTQLPLQLGYEQGIAQINVDQIIKGRLHCRKIITDFINMSTGPIDVLSENNGGDCTPLLCSKDSESEVDVDSFFAD